MKIKYPFNFFSEFAKDTKKFLETEWQDSMLFLFLILVEATLCLICRNIDDCRTISTALFLPRTFVFVLVSFRGHFFTPLLWFAILQIILLDCLMPIFHHLIWS